MLGDRSALRGLAIGAALVAGGAAWAQNLVANGEFESPVINTCFIAIPGGSTFLDDWHVESPVEGHGIDLISQTYCGAGAAHCSVQAVDMAGTPGRGSIYQDLSTSAGAAYVLSFWVSGLEPHAGGLTVEWDGTAIDTIDTPGAPAWRIQAYSVTASSSLTRLRFIGNEDGNRGSFLDSVVVDPSPVFPCPADITGDGAIDLNDLSVLLAHFGQTSGAALADGDMDCDGDVDLSDLSTLLAVFGTQCP